MKCRVKKRITFFLPFFLLAGCTTTKVEIEKKEQEEAPQVFGPKEEYQQKKIVVFVPVGGAKSFAALGLLEVFKQEKIPVETVIGYETGILMASLFSSFKTESQFEWASYQMKDENYKSLWGLRKERGFFTSPEKKEKEWYSWLRANLGSKKFESTNPRIQYLLLPLSGHDPVWVSYGKMIDFVMAQFRVSSSWAFQSIPEPKEFSSYATVEPFPVDEIRRKYPQALLISLNYFQNQDHNQAVMQGNTDFAMLLRRTLEKKNKLSAFDVVVDLNLQTVSYDQYEERKVAVYEGKKAAQAIVHELKEALKP